MLEKKSLIPLYKDVLSWNKVAGNDIRNKNLISLYDGLVHEELNEIFDSILNNDEVEFLDGLIDSLVVGSYLYALIYDDNFDNHENSQSIVNIKSVIEKIKIIDIDKSISKEASVILHYLENVAYTISDEIDIVGAFKEVMSSNWSKFPLVDSVNPENEVINIQKDKRYPEVSYSIVIDDHGNSRYVFRTPKGKVVKPSTFLNPELKCFIP